MPLLVSHDSVIPKQKHTEISVTLIIGHMIDIKYNHTFTIKEKVDRLFLPQRLLEQLVS